ncbi:MAG TPA: anti-sigma factor [Ramlibacter sp.]|nr:anti-sigma factor [Ramlibacter sp.]
MSNQPDSLELTAFVDGELDLARQLEIEALLRDDGALRAQVDRLLGLREAVRSRADYHPAPAALRERIEQQLAAAQAPKAAAGAPSRISASDVLQRWFGWRPLVSALGGAAALAIALQFTLLPAQREEQLGQEVVASHARATLAQRLIDVESSDHHTVKPWLSSRLDFSPPVPEPNLPGTQLLGGRVDYLNGRPVAALVYRHAGHMVDSFVWPAAQGDERVAMSSQRGFHLAHWTRNGMVHWVVSDLNPQEFADLVRELNGAD